MIQAELIVACDLVGVILGSDVLPCYRFISDYHMDMAGVKGVLTCWQGEPLHTMIMLVSLTLIGCPQ